MSGFVMYNRMWHTYYTNVDMKHSFGVSDLKGGLHLAKPLRNHWEFRTGLGIGIQYKRSQPVYPYGGLNWLINDKPETHFLLQSYVEMNNRTAAEDNYFLEIPLMIHYHHPRFKLGIETGLNCRIYYYMQTKIPAHFGPPAYHDDEYGMVVNLTWPITHRLEIKAGWYRGWHYAQKSGVTLGAEECYMYARQHFWQAGIFYDLWYKRKKQKGWVRFSKL